VQGENVSAFFKAKFCLKIDSGTTVPEISGKIKILEHHGAFHVKVNQPFLCFGRSFNETY